ncbi:MAG: GspE/PulE family protein [Candidatus Moranbacteria bacterium]|nr:GspE/PulE family protein [Candidatus Moranbacteria bacterium]
MAEETIQQPKASEKPEETPSDLPADSDISQKAKALGLPFLEKAPKNIVSDVINIMPQEVAEKYKIAAFERGKDTIKVAVINPQDVDVLNALSFVAEQKKLKVEQYLVSDSVFQEIFNFYGGANILVKEAFESFQSKAQEGEAYKESKKSALLKQQEIFKDAPVAKLVEVIISHAIDGKASDIHIEPLSKDYRVRFRVDGILHVSLILPKEIGPVVVSRIKILSNLKIEERRKPQDGRFRLTHSGKEIDFRVSTLPVIDGEKIVMRILDKESGLAQIESLGLYGLALENLKLAIQETYGMILFTGPTGSGKSTSLYALLKVINKEERNIITLEDPIEYNIEGLNQSQIKPEIGYSFASGLRSILRQDPNVIMVGEIRDGETAELAVHAALTGHLLFSTLHTNTAIGAIPRLIDMGIEPFLLSASLRTVVAQRLVRRICEKCREEIKVSETVVKNIQEAIKNISPEEMKKYNLDLSSDLHFYHGKGCEICNGTGLKGRVAIYEVVPVTNAVKNIIIEKAGNERLIEAERDKMGILTIKQDGILKILLGMTTIEEIERVTEGSIALTLEGV